MGSLILYSQKSSCGEGAVNPLYTGRLFHCCMLDESICHFRGVGSILSPSVFDGKFY